MGDLIAAQVLVPEDRLAEFYDRHAAWLRNQEARSDTWEAASDATVALWLFNISDNARKILDYLLAAPTNSAHLQELIDVLGGGSHHVVAGSMSSFGSRKANYGLPIPVLHKHDDYWLDPAAVVRLKGAN